MAEFLIDQWWLVLVVLGSMTPLAVQCASAGLLPTLRSLDRRWIFLLMLWSVLVPIYYIGITGETFPEVPSTLSQATFDEIEGLAEGDRVLLAFDFDPTSEGELGPMATAFVKHAAEKQLQMYFMALWPVGPQMIDNTIDRVIRSDYPDLVYGEDYVNLGFKSGNEAVIRVIVTNLRELYTTDSLGTAVEDIPMMDALITSSRWISSSASPPDIRARRNGCQYAQTPYPEQVRIVAGATGVQAPLLYPYIPSQLPGLLGAIKGAAEYEKLVVDSYVGENPDPKYLEGLRRMGPQLVAHLLIILLIVVANLLYFIDRRAGVR